jgi:septum formation protein
LNIYMPSSASPDSRLVLASASLRRAELLTAAGIAFDVRVADVDETQSVGETPAAYVERLAIAKAVAIIERGERRPVLGADTTVVVDGGVLAKPADAADARRMLRLLSGRTHLVLTGVALIAPARSGSAGRPRLAQVCTTRVTFAPLTEAELAWYVASGEPMDKAGAYAIQGLASRFVTGIDGSYSNVVGLPISHVWAMCGQLGILVS